MRTNINIRLSLLLPALLAPLFLRAQGDPAVLLRTLLESGRITAVYNYDLDGNVPLNGCGTAVLEGNCFRLSSGSLQILCDGSAIYTVDSSAKEVYIENADSAGSPLKDPERLLSGIRDLKYNGNTVSGSIDDPQKGSVLNFLLTDISRSAASGSLDEFRFDTASAGPDWVITDLR